MNDGISDRGILRVLRRLGVRGATLIGDGAGAYRVSTHGRNRSRDRIPPELIETLRRRDLVTGPDDAVVLSASGRAFLRRELAGSDVFGAQHRDLAKAVVVDERGAAHRVTVDRNESPLSWLRSRHGQDGRPMIDAIEFAAGERLRSDFTRGRMMPRVTSNWSAAVAAGRRDGRSGGISDLTDAVISARRRVERAVEAVGPEFGGLLIDFCCFLKGLEDIEREHSWPSRSAKVVLRLGLSALARHYGLALKARGSARASTILHWGTEDYRPALE